MNQDIFIDSYCSIKKISHDICQIPTIYFPIIQQGKMNGFFLEAPLLCTVDIFGQTKNKLQQ